MFISLTKKNQHITKPITGQVMIFIPPNNLIQLCPGLVGSLGKLQFKNLKRTEENVIYCKAT